MMARDIYSVPEIMDVLEVISEKEENRYSDVPGRHGEVMSWTDKAVLLVFARGNQWFPIGQLRKSEDGLSIYASDWILEQKDTEGAV